MHFDTRLVTGILLGMVLGLHYHASLVTVMPLLVIATLILMLRILHK